MTTTRNILQYIKSNFIYQLTEEIISSSKKDSSQEEYEIETLFFSENSTAEVIIYGKTKKTEIKHIFLGPLSKIVMPICARENINERTLRWLTNNYLPSTCLIKENSVKTFDNANYSHKLNSCEHIVLADCTDSTQLMILARFSHDDQELIIIAGPNKYNTLFRKVNSTISTMSVTVNDKEVALFDFSIVNILDQKKHSKKKSIKSVLYQIGPYIWQTLDNLSKNVINNDPFSDTHLTFYEDSVFEFSCKNFGITVRFDGQQIEVISKSFMLMDKLCGLCGNFNGEALDKLSYKQQSLNFNPKILASKYVLKNPQCLDKEITIHKLPNKNEDCQRSKGDHEAICHKDAFIDVLERQLNITNILIS
jgi:hypothetical protein